MILHVWYHEEFNRLALATAAPLTEHYNKMFSYGWRYIGEL